MLSVLRAILALDPTQPAELPEIEDRQVLALVEPEQAQRALPGPARELAPQQAGPGQQQPARAQVEPVQERQEQPETVQLRALELASLVRAQREPVGTARPQVLVPVKRAQQAQRGTVQLRALAQARLVQEQAETAQAPERELAKDLGQVPARQALAVVETLGRQRERPAAERRLSPQRETRWSVARAAASRQ